MVSKKRLPKQETEIEYDDQELQMGKKISDTILKQPKGISFKVNDGTTKIQEKECFFCGETEKPFYAIVKISESGVNAIVSVCSNDIRRVFKQESNGNMTFKMKEAYNY